MYLRERKNRLFYHKNFTKFVMAGDNSSQHSTECWKDFLNDSKKHFESQYALNYPSRLSTLEEERYHPIRIIGNGAFGAVALCRNSNDGNYYAIKINKKSSIVEKGQVKRFLNEKKIMSALKFTFLVPLLDCFQDNSYCYLVMPFIIGGELFSLIQKEGPLPESTSLFYAAQVVLAFEYLHYNNIIFRDLKPENILIHSTGYIKLTDFGFCKVMSDALTYSICGTPEYLAPEVITGNGYSMSADWWTLGILIFEMCFGNTPFRGPDNLTVYKKILAGHFFIPRYFSEELNLLLRRLLEVNVKRRLGFGQNCSEVIKSQQWFMPVNWLKILNHQVRPPFLPTISSEGDDTHFDYYPDTEFLRSSTVEHFTEFAEF